MSKPLYEIFNHTKDGPDLLFMGPTRKCACGSELFQALMWFNEDRSVGGYFTEGCCASCGALVRLVTEADE